MKKNLSPRERDSLLLDLLHQLMTEKITEGQLLRHLRKKVLGLSQDQYAKLTGISRRTLSDLELGKGASSLKLLNGVFKPLGLQVGLLPRSSLLRRQLFETLEQPDPSPSGSLTS
ncbi:helix-turn-helix transcriptional regulator [Azospira inquinata]|uniref:Helix-turn-helix domain-containing protein n=1 Tax=Azospira inquinata TaxID=2785627 RepID=A0A975SKB5_9RHOO|nr:helix-turn-helix domain-containing protein [Azospira inquinata]QWT46787.1 helix-turn-helix domain-containing protein [Azospira inquinata]QWT47890.1 helix-turn-helix domain-containing protein [Azospira inquinata]